MGSRGHGDVGMWDIGPHRNADRTFSFPFWRKIQKHYILESFTAIDRVQLHKEESNYLGFSATASCVSLDVFTASWICP